MRAFPNPLDLFATARPGRRLPAVIPILLLVLVPALASAHEDVSPLLGYRVQALTELSRTGFDAIRVDVPAQRDANGDPFYDLPHFTACGRRSTLSRVRHHASLDGAWEYVCQARFGSVEDAERFWSAMAEQLRADALGFEWAPPRVVNQRTMLRLAGQRTAPSLRATLDLDRVSATEAVVELALRQRVRLAEVKEHQSPPDPLRGANVRVEARRVIRQAGRDFAAIRDDQTHHGGEGGSVAYAVKTPQRLCGPRANQEQVWHIPAHEETWAYTCAVRFASSERDKAVAYYGELARQLRGLRGLRWSTHRPDNGVTLHRAMGMSARTGTSLRLVVDLDETPDGSFEVELWLAWVGPGADGD